jgi:hypothetical protein
METQQTVVAWLKAHPEARVSSSQLFGCSPADVQAVLFSDIHRINDFTNALLAQATRYGAPDPIRDGFADFKQMISDGIAAIDERGSFIQNTMASLAGLQDPKDYSLVLRGALPHAPTQQDKEAVEGLQALLAGKAGDGAEIRFADDERPGGGGLGIETGGSIPACLIGCVACLEVGCFVCCLILFESDADSPQPPVKIQ